MRTTEAIAREVVAGYVQDALGYINPTNDGLLAPWMMARSRAQDAVDALDTVCKAIAARPVYNPGAQALRAICTEPWTEVHSIEELEAALAIPTETPAEREALDRIEAAHPCTFSPEQLREDEQSIFAELLAPFRPKAAV